MFYFLVYAYQSPGITKHEEIGVGSLKHSKKEHWKKEVSTETINLDQKGELKESRVCLPYAL